MRRSWATASEVLLEGLQALPQLLSDTCNDSPKGHRETGKRDERKLNRAAAQRLLRRHGASYVSSGSFTLSVCHTQRWLWRASCVVDDEQYHYDDDYDSLTPVAIGVWCSFVSEQFTSLHKKETVDPCGVAGIFGCNAGATTHAARSGPGYVNINGYKVSLVDVDITLLG